MELPRWIQIVLGRGRKPRGRIWPSNDLRSWNDGWTNNIEKVAGFDISLVLMFDVRHLMIFHFRRVATWVIWVRELLSFRKSVQISALILLFLQFTLQGYIRIALVLDYFLFPNWLWEGAYLISLKTPNHSYSSECEHHQRQSGLTEIESA